MLPHLSFFFFFNDTATTEIYTLSLHDALPISRTRATGTTTEGGRRLRHHRRVRAGQDRKSTRLNSSHVEISYAVFCLKKKNTRSKERQIDFHCRTRWSHPRIYPRHQHCDSDIT